MGLSSEVKIPILKNFHEHIFDRDWHFPSGSSSNCRVLMDRFHLVRKALLELNKSHQEEIKDVIKRTGAGMAKFVDKEIETMDELNEYGQYIVGSMTAAAFTMFPPSRLKDLDSEYNLIANSIGSFLQIVDAICDYLEDIDAIPGPRKLWPREIWSKYVNELEDLKCEENSVEAVQCLNEMVMSSLVHVENCFKYLSALEYNPAMFRICAVLLVKEFGTLALSYNNIDVFKVKVKLRLGLRLKIFKRTRAMSDVYGAFFEFCSLMKSKVDKDDPSAMETLRRLDAIQNICINSGMLNYRLRGCPCF
ncbi:hypothetical protein CRG98_041003 [Punica granatum]|uniref:Squalene synthase 2-like n=1 Tax=Punica granatum TaxID=22663 RepID=A0A2I0I4E5_PUNGR|nr:hypothetical protein CRG98_041003 [Punica granatum]